MVNTHPISSEEYTDSVLSGFFLYDFPLNFNDPYHDEGGVYLTYRSHSKVRITDFDQCPSVSAFYRVEQ